MSDIFFSGMRENFFSPLSGRYREVVGWSIKALYERLYSSNADFSYQLTREELKNVLLEAIQSNPVYRGGNEEGSFLDDKGEVAKANHLISQLVDNGWIEKYMDPIDMQTAFRFTRTGKSFAETLYYVDHRDIRTRQRNVRNTKNSLDAFIRDGDLYDLKDSQFFASRIISDIEDDIADLNEKKKKLLLFAGNDPSRAIEDFISYMEDSFKLDVGIRFAADSLERHRHDIDQLIEDIRNWDPQRIENVNRKMKSGGITSKADIEPLNTVLDSIEVFVESAASRKTPELRNALESYVRRANLIIKQAILMSSQGANETLRSCVGKLKGFSTETSAYLLELLGSTLFRDKPRLIDPAAITIKKQRVKQEIISKKREIIFTTEQLRQIAIEKAQSEAFITSIEQLRVMIAEHMGQESVLLSSDLPVLDAPSLMTLSHAIEVGSVSIPAKEGHMYTVEATGKRARNQYLEYDLFRIRKEPL